MKKQKKKYVSFLGLFENLPGMTDMNRQVIENLSKNFEKIYIINSRHLEFFIKKKNNEEKNYKINIPSNYILFNPKNYKEFNEFLIDKDILIINLLQKNIKDLKIYFFLRYKNIKMIQVSNFGFLNYRPVIVNFKKDIILILKYFFDYIISKKVTVLLASLGLIAKNEILFLSNKAILNSIEKNPIKNFLYKNKLFYVKKIVLVNSRNHDALLKSKHALSEEYIVHLEGGINRPDELKFRKKLDEKTVNNHYYFLNKFLKKLSEEFKKEVIVCIHPHYNLSEYQSYFGQFKVVQFKTSEYIYKSYLATVFDSSAVTDAILLKKRIIGLTSEYMCPSSQKRTELNAQRFGFMTVNVKKIASLDKNKVLSEIERRIPGYESYIKNFHTINNPKVLGVDQIVETIKKKFFND